MVRNQDLDRLSDLLDSGFGRPSPRHGLNLLYWFVTQCLQFASNNRITVLCSPSRGDYGFRLFHNKERLLPPTNLPYYEVGNLHHDRAGELPVYVRREYTGYLDNSNTDRIIISIYGNSLESIYVTSHRNQWTFDPNRTFQISPQLLRTIKRNEREDFLRQTTPRPITIPGNSTVDAFRPARAAAEECCSCRCWCIAVVIILMLVLCAIIFLLVKYLK